VSVTLFIILKIVICVMLVMEVISSVTP